MNSAARFLVSGKVQCVFFRAHTRDKAEALGLRGHAINLNDGRVEVLAAGEADAVQALADWLWQGSPNSQVQAVTRSDADPAAVGEGFRIG